MVIVRDGFLSKSAKEEARSMDFVGGKWELTEVLHVRGGGERERRTEVNEWLLWWTSGMRL